MNAAELLALLVSIPSVSGNERAIADRLTELLRTEGFGVERDGDNIWFAIGGNASPHMLLLSHLDTVPPCDGWETDPFTPTIIEQKMIGLGANDAKGCVAAMILAAGELGRAAIEGCVTFAFVAGEEKDGSGIRTTLPHLREIDAAIVCEPTSLQVCNAQRGMLILRCTARGKSAHVAHATAGENAIHKAARDVIRLADMRFEPHDSLGQARAQVTQISGGLARNQVPDVCEFYVDLRTTPNLRHDALVRQVSGALESEVIVHSARYEPIATDATQPIVQAALEAAGNAQPVSSNTASDWAFLRDIPAVKVGPGDTQRSHRPNEYLLLGELEGGAQFYQRAVRAYFARMAKEVAHA